MDIEETRNAYERATQVFTAPRCELCHHPKEPELINVTVFEDQLPKWVVGWQCPNTFLHTRIKERQRKKDNNNG